MKAVLFLVTLSTLIACTPEAELSVDEDESTIYWHEDENLLAFHVVFTNQASLPAENHYAAFRINDEDLAEAVGDDYLLLETESGDGEPMTFDLDGGDRFFVNETLGLAEDSGLTTEQIKGQVEAVLLNENDEEVFSYTLANINEES
ncbi:hypothetical protein [Salsuginibacillus kocurii]|uniref:hypothetical protein n=1 Tax=Salsuginibacillus kocurii TaxID=427078 RepID=UPI00035DFC79|nr:hypothetical protein [Salsuginibacillus kocurii]